MSEPPASVTYLFSDIEGSTRLWEQQPQVMRAALARHDALTRKAVEGHRGRIVKMTGDGVHAVFTDPLDATLAVLALQLALGEPAADGMALRLRCGLHLGVDEQRDNDYFGPAVNRAARVMSAAHGGQILLSAAVAEVVRERLPAEVALEDLGAVRLRDLSSSERLFQLLHPQLPTQFPALRSLEITPNNLSQQLNRFIGREREVAEVKRLLGENRLVTLLGMGGLGKSRLSVQLAAEVLDNYPDGVWLVELAPLIDPQHVPQAVASVLGIKEEVGRPVLEALLKAVRDRRLLIVLDNCEHLILACAELAKQLLQAGSQVKILASSRDYLRVAGEAAYHVPTLSVPDPSQAPDPDRLLRHEAVRLFADRAAAAQPSFKLNAANAAAVADICRRLDGIPLALELAAARARSLPVAQIAQRLGDRFKLLVSGDRTLLPRQQTLRALIDWSYDLLDARERALFERLSVFAGGWTLEAAEAVGCGDDLPAEDVLDLLSHLVEKSLVLMEADSGRYRMLDTVRQYAQEKLAEREGEAGTRERHLGFYLAFVEADRPASGAEQAQWLGRLDLERENLLVAQAWCDRAVEGAQRGLRLAFAVRPYWVSRGLLALGLRFTLDAVVRARSLGRTPLVSRGLFVAGQFCCFMGRFEEAQNHLEECLDMARAMDDKPRIANALQLLGMASVGQGDLPAARARADESVALAKALGKRIHLASAVTAAAQLDRLEGKLDSAKRLYEEALALAYALDNQEYVIASMLNLAMVALGQRAFDEALDRLSGALSLAIEIASVPAGCSALEVSAGFASLKEEWHRAATYFGAAEAQTHLAGVRRDPADEAFLRPLVDQARVVLGHDAFSSAEAAGRGARLQELLVETQRWLKDQAAAPGGHVSCGVAGSTLSLVVDRG